MMRYQQTDSWCGPACVVNALRCYGRKISQRTIARLCSTDHEGTTDIALVAALSDLGYHPSIFESDCRKEAALWLNRAAEVPLILCAYSWRHWVLVAGIVAGRYLLHDPDNSRENARENGCHALSLRTLLKHWRAGRRIAKGEPRFYGIAVEGPV